MSGLMDFLEDYGATLLGVSVAIALVLFSLGGAVGVLKSAASPSPTPHNRVATVGDDVDVYRIGVTTADGRVAECLVTSTGGIHCFDQVEDAW